LVEIPQAVGPVKTGVCFQYIALMTILGSEAECAGDMHSLEWHWSLIEISFIFCQEFDLWKPYKNCSIYSSGGHFVQRSGTCGRYAQQGMVLITPVKFHWNPPAVWAVKVKQIFLSIAQSAILCSGEAEHACDMHN
jgi:hypothetical protein